MERSIADRPPVPTSAMQRGRLNGCTSLGACARSNLLRQPRNSRCHLVRRAPQDPSAKMAGDGTSNWTSGEPRRKIPRDETTPFHDSNHATARSTSGRSLSSTLGSRSRITPASTSPASSRAATKLRSFSLNAQSLATQRSSFQTPTGELRLPSRRCRVGVLHFHQPIAPPTVVPKFPDRRRRC
jgi:hypothetical protein